MEKPSVFTLIMYAAMKVLYTDPKPFLDMIAKAPDPRQGIVMAANIVLGKVKESLKGIPAQQVNQEAPLERVHPIVLQMVFELAVEAGIIKNPTKRGLIGRAQAQQPAQVGA